MPQSWPDRYHGVRLGANVRINALTVWRVAVATPGQSERVEFLRDLAVAMILVLAKMFSALARPPIERATMFDQKMVRASHVQAEFLLQIPRAEQSNSSQHKNAEVQKLLTLPLL